MQNILIVDDSPTEVFVLSEILKTNGYQVTVANDGEEGIKVAKEILPDLILMDVVMPGLNGFQATRKLHRDEQTKQIPIIMVTTKDQDTDKEWGIRQGAKDYLVKPVDGAELIKKLEQYLDG